VWKTLFFLFHYFITDDVAVSSSWQKKNQKCTAHNSKIQQRNKREREKSVAYQTHHFEEEANYFHERKRQL